MHPSSSSPSLPGHAGLSNKRHYPPLSESGKGTREASHSFLGCLSSIWWHQPPCEILPTMWPITDHVVWLIPVSGFLQNWELKGAKRNQGVKLFESIMGGQLSLLHKRRLHRNMDVAISNTESEVHQSFQHLLHIPETEGQSVHWLACILQKMPKLWNTKKSWRMFQIK